MKVIPLKLELIYKDKIIILMDMFLKNNKLLNIDSTISKRWHRFIEKLDNSHDQSNKCFRNVTAIHTTQLWCYVYINISSQAFVLIRKTSRVIMYVIFLLMCTIVWFCCLSQRYFKVPHLKLKFKCLLLSSTSIIEKLAREVDITN